jgi:ABC-2 type transport system ATP-binding protein
METAILTENLTKIYEGKGRFGKSMRVEALVDLNLEVKRGEIFGFLGPNGAGKSTTLKLITNLIFPTKGKVFIFGIPAEDEKARSRVGFLPESPVFYNYLTAEEFLLYLGNLYGLRGKYLKERVRELLDWVGLTPHKNRYLRKYSKGMLQRVGIAQALLHDPDLVLLDEPTSGLDPLGRKMVLDLIRNLKEEGKTVFFSTHILADVEAVADRVGIIVDGRLKKLGPLSVLLEDRDMYEVKVEGLRDDVLPLLRLYSKKVERENGKAKILVPSEKVMWSVMDILRKKGAKLLSVEQKRKTLEEVFLEEAGMNFKSGG